MNIDLSKRVGQFVGVSQDNIKSYPNGQTLRFVLYGAYDAFGLIGSEFNGIAILDEKHKSVVVQGLVPQDSGYFGPSKAQVEAFNALTRASQDELPKVLKSLHRE